MNEKYGWQYNSYDDVDYYKLYKDYVCKESLRIKPKKEAIPKKIVMPKPQFNPLLLLVA